MYFLDWYKKWLPEVSSGIIITKVEGLSFRNPVSKTISQLFWQFDFTFFNVNSPPPPLTPSQQPLADCQTKAI